MNLTDDTLLSLNPLLLYILFLGLCLVLWLAANSYGD